ncbi:hypothetical protein DL238_04785 [Alteriqipengyuania lutimaris]|uniref:Uncharacterized protein n=1 Tax=Alteriqipengyuania lutimaris TaxID=1538146 RepID=A0A395LJY1_9SPHN|nr:hypothetical protein DL238_04785 [Alteriqipengyuania lutimaris]
MVRHRLDSVNDFGRQGYWLRILCKNCGHVAERNPTPLLLELHARELNRSIESLEARAKCSDCGHRGATISACEPSS